MSLQPTSDEIQRWISSADDLLPGNATRFERALLAAELHHKIDVSIGVLWRPDECPEALLPYLAWALSVDVWSEAWPVLKKRDVIKQSVELHRLKGTLEGIRRYAAFADGEVVRAITPPATNFLSAGLSLADRLAFMRRLPEIRIATQDVRSTADARSFCGTFDGEDISSFDVDEEGRIAAFYVESRAREFFGRRARFIDVERDIDVPVVIETIIGEDGRPIPGAERYLLPGDGNGSSFLDGGPVEQDFFGETTAPARLVSVSLVAAGLDGLDGLTSAREGLTPLALSPEMVALDGIARDGVFSGQTFGGWHFVEDRASVQLYQSIRLHDPNRDVIGGAAVSFMNDARFGIDPHTAELLVSIRDVRSIDAVGDFIGGFFIETPPDAMHRVLDAIGAASAAHETILVDTTVDRAPRLGDRLFLGSFRLGQPVRG